MNIYDEDYLFAEDPEQVLIDQYTQRIAENRIKYQAAPHSLPKKKFRILLAGYSGAHNTGADIRTGEIIRQLREQIGEDRLILGAVAVGQTLPEHWGEVICENFNCHPPEFVAETCARYDAVVVTEGSLFTSTFSNGLALLLMAFLAMAEAQGKPAIAYGAEADEMHESLMDFANKHLRHSLIIARNEPSQQRLLSIGLNALLGTDTGWTFLPRPSLPVEQILHTLGWNGRTKILTICPVNPFCWPLKSDPMRALFLSKSGVKDSSHYGGMSFFQDSDLSESSFEIFIDAIATGIQGFIEQSDESYFPVIIGMEALDREACRALARRLKVEEIILSDELEQHAIIELLRASELLISARFHAILLSMSAGVPAVGLAYDQRVPALLSSVRNAELSLLADDDNLKNKIKEKLLAVEANRQSISSDFKRFAEQQRSCQLEMSQNIFEYLASYYPECLADRVS